MDGKFGSVPATEGRKAGTGVREQTAPLVRGLR